MTRAFQIEIADIFREHGPAYRCNHRLPIRMLRVMSAIERCRTAELGGHVDECDACGYRRISYNSCRNRHCPKCQSLAKEEWLAARREDLLPVEYFHVVFTIPDSLGPLALRNQKAIYDLLFESASETLLELGNDPKHLGAEIGFIAILHTWGQNLMDHPHLHCLVPGGGLAKDGSRWISTRENYLLPVRVLSRLFRGKFLHGLRESIKESTFVGLPGGNEWRRILDDLYAKEWVVYSKPSFAGACQVLEYLGRYTHRVAIANHRLVSMEKGCVMFWWRDYRDGTRKSSWPWKAMNSSVVSYCMSYLKGTLRSGITGFSATGAKRSSGNVKRSWR